MIDVAQEPASHWGQQEHKLVGVEIIPPNSIWEVKRLELLKVFGMTTNQIRSGTACGG